jgi:DNA-binding transcriptional regulator YiaG
MTADQMRAIRQKMGLNTVQLAALLPLPWSHAHRLVKGYERGWRIPSEVELRLTGVCPCCKKPAPESLIQIPWVLRKD